MLKYIDIDNNNFIIGAYSVKQSEGQILADIPNNISISNLKYINGEVVIDNVKLLNDYKKQKVEELKQLHIAFMERPFKVTITRDDLTPVSFWLNCTDETANNLNKALEACKLEGTIYFYNGGSDADLSLIEMSNVVKEFNKVCLPSFRIKGENKIAINMATSIEQVDTIFNAVTF